MQNTLSIISNEELDALMALYERTAPGEWIEQDGFVCVDNENLFGDTDFIVALLDSDEMFEDGFIVDERYESEINFIIESRKYLPLLVQEVRKLRSLVKDTRL